MSKQRVTGGVLAMVFVLAVFCGVLSLPPQASPVFCEVEEWQHG